MPKAKSTQSRFELDGEVLEFDIASLTFGEVEIVEEYFDCPLDEVHWSSGRGGLIACFLAKRRKDPTITLDDLRDVKVSALKASEAKPKRPTRKGPGDSGTHS